MFGRGRRRCFGVGAGDFRPSWLSGAGSGLMGGCACWGRLAASFRGSNGPAYGAGPFEGGGCCKTPHWGVFAGWLGAGRAGLIPSGPWPTATFFFSFKKKGAKPLRAKSCPFGAVALRDAAAAAEMRPPVRMRGYFAPCGERPGRRPGPATL